MPNHPEEQVGAGADQIIDRTGRCRGFAGQGCEGVQGGIHAAQRRPRRGQPGLAQFGQRHLAGAPSEQLGAGLMLEQLDRRRQGLADEQPFGGPPIVELFGQNEEVAQLSQREVDARSDLLRRWSD